MKNFLTTKNLKRSDQCRSNAILIKRNSISRQLIGPTSRRAFVLLFSLLISSILLAAGLGISRLMVRQINLASLSRESQVAFFAADSGIECALHWYYFASFDPATDPINHPESRSIFCNGQAIRNGSIGVLISTNQLCDALGEPPAANKLDGSPKSCFTFSLSPNLGISPRNQPCAFVVVDTADPLTTKITSNGYNRCDLGAPNTLQRTLVINLVNQ